MTLKTKSDNGTVLIMGTLDTKGEELGLLQGLIAHTGLNTLLMDTNMGGEPQITPDISAAEVARVGGGEIEEIRSSRDTGKYTPVMIKGATVKALELYREGRIDGIISIGGASGTALGTTVMKALPFGLPKLMVSSTASMPDYAAGYIGTRDITMMHSVVDIAGLNELVRDVLARAAGAISGMVVARTFSLQEQAVTVEEPEIGAIRESPKPVKTVISARTKPLIALTEFKFSEKCCKKLRDSLLERGYEVIAFHAQGIGDQAMDELIEQGWFDGVLDIVPAGVSEGMLGGNRSGGPNRLLAAGDRGIPMVVTPCGFDMLSCGPLERREFNDPLWTSRHLTERKLFIPDAFRVQARTTIEEVVEIANETAVRLKIARGAVKFLVPLKGWSSLSSEGGTLYDPETDRVFTEVLKRELAGSSVEVIELNYELNSQEFAQYALGVFIEMMEDRKRPFTIKN